MWFLPQFEEESAAYEIPVAYRLTGELRVDALQASLNAIVERHEILGTTYPSPDGAPVQVIGPPQEVPRPLIELESCDPSEREATVQDIARAEVLRRFDLSRETPSLRRVPEEAQSLDDAARPVAFPSAEYRSREPCAMACVLQAEKSSSSGFSRD